MDVIGFFSGVKIVRNIDQLMKMLLYLINASVCAQVCSWAEVMVSMRQNSR